MLRSKTLMTVGLGESGGVLYAFSSVKLTPSDNVVDLFDAIAHLGRELEAFTLIARGI